MEGKGRVFSYIYEGRLGGVRAEYGGDRFVVVWCIWLFEDPGGVVRGLSVNGVCFYPMCPRVWV